MQILRTFSAGNVFETQRSGERRKQIVIGLFGQYAKIAKTK